jgi:hypothetical protein
MSVVLAVSGIEVGWFCVPAYQCAGLIYSRKSMCYCVSNLAVKLKIRVFTDFYIPIY